MNRNPINELSERMMHDPRFDGIHPEYILVSQRGPAHHPMFMYKVKIGEHEFVCRGEHTRAMNAKRSAAIEALKWIKQPPQQPKPKPVLNKAALFDKVTKVFDVNFIHQRTFVFTHKVDMNVRITITPEDKCMCSTIGFKWNTPYATVQEIMEDCKLLYDLFLVL